MNTDDDPPVIRTDFSNEVAWEEVCELIAAPQTERNFLANVRFVSDEQWRDLQPEAVYAQLKDRQLLFVVDRLCLQSPEHPVLVLGAAINPAEEGDDGFSTAQSLIFRALPCAIQSIENNVSIGNMGLEEFADFVDDERVFRGF